MILGADGKRIGGDTLLMTPEWLLRDLKADNDRIAANQRVMALRYSIGGDFAVDGPHIGATVHVRRPSRYARTLQGDESE
jgi:hypothetical protein